MKKFLVVLAAVALSIMAVSAVSAAPGKLRSEVVGSGQVLIYSSSSAYISNTAGEGYAAIYTSAKSPAGKRLSAVDMGFVAEAGGLVSGGSPRITIPIDTDGNGAWDDFASIDVFSCGGTVDGDSRLITDVWVSTANTACSVSLNFGSGAGTYANWDAMAAANPTWKIAKGQQAFIIADWDAGVNLTSIDLN